MNPLEQRVSLEPSANRAPAWRTRWGGVSPRILGLFVALVLSVSSLSQTQEVELEYKLKAAFLFNFLKFTEWPTNKYTPSEPSTIVGFMADDPCIPFLTRALEGKALAGNPIRLVTFHENDDPRNCHLLFLGRSRKNQIEETLARLQQAPVLTVSEVDQFGQRGGILNFFRHEKTFRFEINLEAAEAAHLRISSDLSSMATVVKTQRAK